MYRTKLFTDSWAVKASRPYAWKSGFSDFRAALWNRFQREAPETVPQHHAEYWKMVGEEMRQPVIVLKVV